MKHLKKYYGIYIFAAIALSIVAYWWFFRRDKGCKVYAFVNLDTEGMTSNEQDQYYKKYWEGITEEEEKEFINPFQDLFGDGSIYLIKDDIYYARKKESFKLMEGLFKKKGIKYKIECASDDIVKLVEEKELQNKKAEEAKQNPSKVGDK